MKKAILTVLFTILITVVFVAPITLAYLLTKPMVALNEEVFLKKSVLFAAGITLPPTNEQIVTLFSQRVKAETPAAGPAWYRVRGADGDSTAGYVFLRSGPGLWGEITATVGFDAAFAALTGVDFLKQTETPGLGARISEDWFREQFRGKKGPLSSVPEGEPAGESQFDAITGATITSNAVLAILNSAFAQAPDLVK
jgi:Na+-transporting NADH:ubiquinone oxidoreductase subunit C